MQIAQLAEMEVKHRCNQILELSCPLGRVAKLFAQDWEGDITIFMPVTLGQVKTDEHPFFFFFWKKKIELGYLFFTIFGLRLQLSKAIQNPSCVELQISIDQGRRCTWEKLSSIKANCGIEIALDECVATLRRSCGLKTRAERAATVALSPTVKFNGLRRIPSWNVISRQNSTASLEGEGEGEEEGLMAEPPLSPYQGEDHSSWTRSGGPLMRSVSSKRFVEFVQNLRLDSRIRRED